MSQSEVDHPLQPVVRSDFRHKLAIALYREDMLSFGKARELAELDTYEFGQLLGEREIPRHYGQEELEEDLRFARGDVSPNLSQTERRGQ